MIGKLLNALGITKPRPELTLYSVSIKYNNGITLIGVCCGADGGDDACELIRCLRYERPIIRIDKVEPASNAPDIVRRAIEKEKYNE